MLRLRGVSKTYPTAQGAVTVLAGIDLDLGPGQTLALTGESGSGKSTLLHLIAGLDTPDAGTVEVAGQAVGALDERGRAALRRSVVGLIFQQFNLIPSLTVASNLAFQARLARREDPGWTTTLAERLGLSALLGRYPEQLSGGQMQRVAIGRALAARPAADPGRRADRQSRRGDGRRRARPRPRAGGRNGGGPSAGDPQPAPCGPAGAPGASEPRAACMSRVWVLRVLLSHWARRPFQLGTLLLGLAVATALWSGVQAINAEARAAYTRAAAVVGGESVDALVDPGRGRIAQATYLALRRAGWPVSPVLEGSVRVAGRDLRLIGIDPLTAPRGFAALPEGDLAAFILPPHQAFAAPGAVPGRMVEGIAVTEVADIAPGIVIVDLGVAQRLLRAEGMVSRLLLTGPPPRGTPPLDTIAALERVPATAQSDLERLTDSFHLNLRAFGFLAFLVGLFIVHAAIGLAFEQRRPMLRTLRACGVPAGTLTVLLGLELVGLALLAGGLGVAAGGIIAGLLLPDVALSLRGLYGAEVPGTLTLRATWWLAGLGIAVGGAVAAAGLALWRAWRLPVLATAQPMAWRGAQIAQVRAQALLAAAFALAAAAFAVFGDGLQAGFALLGAMLLAAALALPGLLALGLGWAASRARGPVAAWVWADARQQIGALSLALMALLVALSVNIGVGTMVASFRATFTGWLDQRLAAEVYVTARDAAEGADLTAFAEARGAQVLPIWSAETRAGGWPASVYGFRDHATYRDTWPMIAILPDAWDRVAAGEAMMVSEQLARRLGLSPGDRLDLPEGWGGTVAGIYPDYGNPKGQVMVALARLIETWPGAERRRFALRTDPATVPALMTALSDRFGYGPEVMVDQGALKAFSLGVFERTFLVTGALNTLTLGIAGLALFTGLLTLATSRLPQLAPVWALGLTRGTLARLELAKALGLAAITALLAVPLGLALAWVLTVVVNVRAFGWRLPVHVYPADWAVLVGAALLTAARAAALPARRRARH